MTRAPMLDALDTLRTGDASAAAIQAAAAHVNTAFESLMKNVCGSFFKHRLFSRIVEYEDMMQDCVGLLLTKVVNHFTLPEDCPEDNEKNVCNCLGGYARKILVNYWRGRLRHLVRNRENHPINEQTVQDSVDLAFQHEGSPEIHFIDIRGGHKDDPSEDIMGVLEGALAPTDFYILTMRYRDFSTTDIGKVIGMTRKGVQQRIRTKIRPVLSPLLEASGLLVPSTVG